jgi:phage terminase large subunit-like protein/Ni,Fe-hydrogenase maturation factor
MKTKFMNILIAALLVFGALMATHPVYAHSNEGHELEGVISAIDTGAGTVTITPKEGGADVVLKVDSTTVIKRNDKIATLADLQVSDRVEAEYDPATMLASRISARLNLVGLLGVISAIDTTGSTLTVTPKTGGPDVVLKVDSSTGIKRNGKTATLADLQLGDRVEARYNPVTMLATKIFARLNLVGLSGVISAIDPIGSTLTVTPKGGGADVVLKVDSATIIKRNGKTATLADLQLGDRVEARYNPVTMLAANISARLNLVPLSGVISAIDPIGSTLTVTPKKGGADIVLKVDSATIIKRNGISATLADLQVTDRVEAKYNPVSMLAASINARQTLAEVEGTISAVDTGAGTVTVTPEKGGADVVLKVDSATIIKRNGITATLADLQVTDQVEAKYIPVSMLAVKIEAEMNLAELEGQISAIDTGAGTVTITPKEGGADMVLIVDSTTVIKRNGTTAALTDLQVTDQVEAKYNPVSMLAVKIEAEMYLAEIHGSISAIDTGAGTVTITPKEGGADIVLLVDSTTVIKRHGTIVALADLQVGDHVDAKYSPLTMLAVRIEVED